MGHAGKDMSDLYDKIKEDVVFRRERAERSGLASTRPQLYRMYRKSTQNAEAAKAA